MFGQTSCLQANGWQVNDDEWKNENCLRILFWLSGLEWLGVLKETSTPQHSSTSNRNSITYGRNYLFENVRSMFVYVCKLCLILVSELTFDFTSVRVYIIMVRFLKFVFTYDRLSQCCRQDFKILCLTVWQTVSFNRVYGYMITRRVLKCVFT